MPRTNRHYASGLIQKTEKPGFGFSASRGSLIIAILHEEMALQERKLRLKEDELAHI
jgi:hypothetical protein